MGSEVILTTNSIFRQGHHQARRLSDSPLHGTGSATGMQMLLL